MYKSNYFKVSNSIIDDETLGLHEKMVLMVLHRYTDNKMICFPSYETISKKSGICKSIVIRTIKKLIDKGIIIKIKRKIEKADTSNIYRIISGVCSSLGCVSDITPQCTTYTLPSVSHTHKKDLLDKDPIINTHHDSVCDPISPIENISPIESEKINITIEEPSKPIHKKSSVDVKELKTKIENTIQSPISYKSIANLLLHSNPERINYYIDNWDKFTTTTIDNTTAFFISAVKKQYELPKQYIASKRNNIQQQNYIPQHHNFEQRKYTDEEFDSFYANVPKKINYTDESSITLPLVHASTLMTNQIEPSKNVF